MENEYLITIDDNIQFAANKLKNKTFFLFSKSIYILYY